MSGDQRTTTKWMIRVDGSDLTSVEAGQTVEIGRKPLRPLADDGVERVEILDDTRSMSKRHAEFSVKSDGNAILRDLDSTNGTYLVRPGDELVRLDGGADFAMTDDTVRLQFGDVPIDFVRFIDDEDPARDDAEPVANLFDYALDNAPAEPEAADMSVDDILDLRAGEPTNIFEAHRVRTRARELREAEQQTFVPFAQPINPVETSEAAAEDDEDAAPRDLFADAHDVAAGKIEEPAVTKEEFVPRRHDGPRHAGPRAGDRLIAVDELAKPRADVNLSAAAVSGRHMTRSGQPADQENVRDAQGTDAAHGRTAPARDDFARQHAALGFDVLATSLHVARTGEAVAVDVRGTDEPSGPRPTLEEVHAQPQARSFVADGDEAREEAAPLDAAAWQDARFAAREPAAAEERVDDQAEEHVDDHAHDRFRPSADAGRTPALEETQAFTPAFEPGSVFERVANGDFDRQEEVIEAGGYTSDQARRSEDFSEQFEMARVNELLPFLAMNPGLYDDLYAWLAAQGDADIDAALSRNPGYEDYRKAVGK